MNPISLENRTQLAVHIRKFLSWLTVTNHSSFTIKNRRTMLSVFYAWCTNRGIVSATEVTRKTLEQYRRYLFHRTKPDGSSLTSTTQSQYLVAVRVFFAWLQNNDLILVNPSAELDLPRAEFVLPKKILTPAQVEKVMAQPDCSTLKGIRDRAMLEVLYSSGIRRNELVHIDLDDVNLDKRLLFIRQGKGGKDRVVPIGSRACTSLDRYIHEVRPSYVRKHSPNIMFLTYFGTPINPDVVTRMVKDYINKAGIESGGSCHVLRHSMATSMLENGADIRYIQSILGHTSLDSTQIYTRVSIMKLKEVHSRTHPARLKKDRP